MGQKDIQTWILPKQYNNNNNNNKNNNNYNDNYNDDDDDDNNNNNNRQARMGNPGKTALVNLRLQIPRE
jgi:hypothetical protein